MIETNGDATQHLSEGDNLVSTAQGYIDAMNQALSNCLEYAYPPIQYPPQYRLNPVQQDAMDIAEIENRLSAFFIHAKQLEIVLLSHSDKENVSDIETEIQALEAELLEKDNLIRKYGELAKAWEQRFESLQKRMRPGK